MGDIKLALEFTRGITGQAIVHESVTEDEVIGYSEYGQPYLSPQMFQNSRLRNILNGNRHIKGIVSDEASILYYGDIGFKFNSQSNLWEKLTYSQVPEIGFIIQTTDRLSRNFEGPFFNYETAAARLEEIADNMFEFTPEPGMNASVKLLVVKYLIWMTPKSFMSVESHVIGEASEISKRKKVLRKNDASFGELVTKFNAIAKNDRSARQNTRLGVKVF